MYHETTIRQDRFTDIFQTDRERGESNSNDDCYQVGEYFYYCDVMKHDDHYCKPKYPSMKAELTQNKYITTEQYDKAKREAQSIWDQINTFYTIYCDNRDRKCFDKFGVRLYCRDYPYYNERFNIAHGTKITVLHLTSVILYFNHSKLASMICKTFRASNNETYDDIKQRHSNFANTCRYICETITLYGNDLPKNKYVYRGVNNSSFAWLDACWNGPVSTTTDINVARKYFAKSTGSVLKLNHSESGFPPMFIDGSKILSKFAHEKEYLMWSPCLSIVDFPFYQNKRINVYESISAIRLFQKLINGHLFNKEERDELLSQKIQHQLLKLMQCTTNMESETTLNFAQMLFQTTLSKLFTATTNTVWRNPVLNVNEDIQKYIYQNGLHHQENIKYSKLSECQVKKWTIETDELDNMLLPWFNNNAVKDCDDMKNDNIATNEEPVQLDQCWECNIDFNGKCYVIKVVMLMMQSSNDIANEFYDVHILTYEYPEEIDEKNNLMLSFDLLCDELDICLHFCPRKVATYRQRSHTQIVTAQQIETLIKSQSGINWSVALRYFYE